jgi:opacity protein-like surface antigen
MKKNQFLISLIAFILSGISKTSNSAEEGRFFFGLSGGYQRYFGYFSDIISPNQSPNDHRYNIECKQHFSGAPFSSLIAGYELSNNLKVGLSFSYTIGKNESKFGQISHNNLNGINNYGAIVRISNSWDVAANLIYYTIPDSTFSPLIGVKLGYSSRTVDIDPKSSVVIDKTRDNKKSNNGILFGAMTGISYKLNDKTRIELTYSIDKQSKAETSYGAGFAGTGIIKAPNLSHKVGLGMTFAF